MDNRNAPEKTADSMSAAQANPLDAINIPLISSKTLQPGDDGHITHNSSMAPIERLPPEILVHIFHMHVELGRDPWALTAIWNKWRRIAFDTPILWRHILVVGDRGDIKLFLYDSGYSETLKKMQICATSPHLDDALARARSAPLDVILSVPTNMLREQPLRELASMYHKLFGEQEICARIAKLTIPELPLPLVLDMGTFLPHSTRAPSFPMLRELIYRNTAGKAWHSVVAQMISSSHGLRSLDVSAYLLDKTKHSGIWDPNVWGKLHHLRVNASGWTRVGLRSLDIIIPWSRSIKELVITDILWPIVETPDRITFPNLRQAKLWSTSKGLALIHAPLLESLEVRLLSVNADGDNHRLDMPALRTITVSGNVQRWIYKSNLPNLHSLTVLNQDFYNEGSTPPSEVFVPGGLPLVQEATFKGSCGGRFQIVALESVPNAQRITIIQTPFVQPPATPQLSRSLVWRLSAKGSSLLSPHARRIQLGEPQFGFQAPDDALDRLLDKIVEVRRQRGCPLESLSVYWHRFLGPSEYVSL